mmetsp:Transcript_38738/g.129584  ORF Transcript_38738/g.129584 Transcript_38738/m.129584 type:complete len:264 (-) Transcript_38738:165-956(-)
MPSLSLSLPWRGAAADRERARRRVPEHHLRLCERRERLRHAAAGAGGGRPPELTRDRARSREARRSAAGRLLGEARRRELRGGGGGGAAEPAPLPHLEDVWLLHALPPRRARAAALHAVQPDERRLRLSFPPAAARRVRHTRRAAGRPQPAEGAAAPPRQGGRRRGRHPRAQADAPHPPGRGARRLRASAGASAASARPPAAALPPLRHPRCGALRGPGVRPVRAAPPLRSRLGHASRTERARGGGGGGDARRLCGRAAARLR